MEIIVMQNLRLHEVAKVSGELMKTITTEEDNDANMSKRISSRAIYGNAGSATGDEALAMLKDKDERKEATTAFDVATKDQAKDK